jgi:hypothetical protein
MSGLNSLSDAELLALYNKPDLSSMSDADLMKAYGAAPKEEPGSSLGGVAKSLGVGAAEGLIGLAGLLGDVSMIGIPNNPESPYGSAAIKKAIEDKTGEFYKPQGGAEQFANTAGQFLPAVVGGPETLAAKLATRVAVPAAASEAAGALTDDNPFAKVAGALTGAVGATAAARKFQQMGAARKALPAGPSADDHLKTASGQFKSAEDMNLVTVPDFAIDAASKMRADLRGFDPEAQAAVFKAADRLESLAPKIAANSKPSPAAASPLESVSSNGEKAPVSLLQFIASKGGLLPDAELEAIGLARGHRTQIPGQPGFFGVVSNKGQNIDRVREAAEEAGYLRGQNGATSTPRELLDAIDAELRGQKRYPEGFEGFKTRRENVVRSEREQHAFDAHIRGFEDSLAKAGHGQVSPDVKKRAINLMEREGMDADTAVEHALLQLDQEDAVAGIARANKPAFAHGFPPDMAKGVAMNDVELIRKQLTTLKTSQDASVREAARRAISSLQESQTALTPAQVINGDAGTYTKLMSDAIGNWAAGKRSNIVMGKVALGELNSATAGSGANDDNALRQAFKQLARPVNNDITPKWQRLGFNKQEGAAIERVARGSLGGNTARYLGKLAPTGSVSGVLSGGAGFAAAGPMGAIGLPAAGYIAKKIGDLSTKRAVAAVDSLVRSRSPLAAQVAAQLPPQVIQQLPPKTQRLLQTLILADPVLSQQPRQAVGQPAAQ